MRNRNMFIIKKNKKTAIRLPLDKIGCFATIKLAKNPAPISFGIRAGFIL